jgi:predicted metal-dependent hydrolase
MTDEAVVTQISVSGLIIDVIRKDIKNLHLSVMPPQGRVRVAAPLAVSDDRVRAAVVCRLAWIKRQQLEFEEQPRQSAREMVSGESHYFMGQRYLLEVIEKPGMNKMDFKNNQKLRLYVGPGTGVKSRQEILLEWYRKQLKKRVAVLLTHWQRKIGVEVSDWGIKKMKTRWGTCNIAAKRIWLNLELAKKSPDCLEYVLVHELVHLLERHHNDQFRAHMDGFMPNWRLHRSTLNSAPLANEDWSY